MHPGKCVFGADSIEFLGHRISANKLEPQQDKIAAVRDLPAPTDLSGLRAALGHFSCYRKFVPHFSTIAFPHNALKKKDRPWEWGKAHSDAFGELKEQLCSAAVLKLPNPYSPFILTTDWSQRGMGVRRAMTGWSTPFASLLGHAMQRIKTTPPLKGNA